LTRVSDEKDEKPRVEPLTPSHDRSEFESGVEPLDRYFRTQAGQDARKNMAALFVLLLADGTIGGYYTLSSTGCVPTVVEIGWAASADRLIMA
jgi:hypothetical protein